MTSHSTILNLLSKKGYITMLKDVDCVYDNLFTSLFTRKKIYITD